MHTTTSGELPGKGVAGAQRNERLAAKVERLRHAPLRAQQGRRAAVVGQPIEVGAVLGGEGFELVECPGLLECDRIELEGSMRGIDAGAAARRFLRAARVRRTVGAQER